MPQYSVRLPDDGIIFLRDEGEGNPVLFVHGFPLDHSMWNAQMEFLSETHRCLAVDLRGFGQSSVEPGTFLMERMADDLAALLIALKIRKPVTLCGLSMGGYVAWQFWRRHPSMLARLILCDTRAVADTEDARKQRLEAALKLESQGAEFLADAMLPKLYATETRQSQPELIAACRAVMLANPPAGIAAAARGMAERPDVTAWLPKINVPSLLITGEKDAISSVEEMAAIAKTMPDAYQVVIPASGHMAPQEQPTLVNEAISEFLNRAKA